jgi:hypothetical protein
LLGKTTQTLEKLAVEPSVHFTEESGLTPQSHLVASLQTHFTHPPSAMYPKEQSRLQPSGLVLPELVVETGVALESQVVGGTSAQSQSLQPEASTFNPLTQVVVLEQLIAGQGLQVQVGHPFKLVALP